MTKSHNTKTAALFAKYDVMNRFAQKQIIKQTKNEIVDYSQFLDFNKPRTSTDYIFLHCTDTETATLAAVANYHMFRKNWPSIAYHYLVMKDGKIIRCLKPESESTHAKGFNFNSVSICFEGDFDVDTISQTQYNSGLRLLFALHTKYPNAEITTHAEHSKKTCPGLIFPDDKMEYQALNFHFLNLVKK
jgi:N-acetylmuramoyl-L-alanine amidase